MVRKKGSTSDKPVLAVDLGGTKILAAIISRNGEVLAREYSLTQADAGKDAVVERLIAAIDHILKTSGMTPLGLTAISIAAAGVIDDSKGIVTKSPNLPGWTDVPLKSIIESRFGVPAFVINDANAAAIGEHRLGAGRGARDFLFVTVSTGIGGGVIIDGKLYTGVSGGAGEFGHMTIDINGERCSCGNYGCFELLASGTALAKEAVKRIRQGEKSSLVGMVNGRLEDIAAEKVEDAAEAGDTLSREVILQIATCLGVGLVNLVNIFNPEVIVIGGGLSKMGDVLLEPARGVVRDRAFRLLAEAVRIVPAELGDDAGIFGAAQFAFDESR